MLQPVQAKAAADEKSARLVYRRGQEDYIGMSNRPAKAPARTLRFYRDSS